MALVVWQNQPYSLNSQPQMAKHTWPIIVPGCIHPGWSIYKELHYTSQPALHQSAPQIEFPPCVANPSQASTHQPRHRHSTDRLRPRSSFRRLLTEPGGWPMELWWGSERSQQDDHWGRIMHLNQTCWHEVDVNKRVWHLSIMGESYGWKTRRSTAQKQSVWINLLLSWRMNPASLQ